MNTLDRVVSWLILGIGILHCGVTFVMLERANENVFWFFSGGLAMIYCAALNLLRVRYAALAPGLRSVCVPVNLSMLAFTLAYAASKGMRIFRNPGAVLLIACAFALVAFSMRSLGSQRTDN